MSQYKDYIGVKLIMARPMEKDGVPGYEVVYPDSYTSWSPKDVFEKAYRQRDDMNFGLAIEAAKLGKKISRRGWNGKGMYCEIQIPDDFSKMKLPYFYMKTVNGDLVPWVASQTDLLSDDWFIFE